MRGRCAIASGLAWLVGCAPSPFECDGDAQCVDRGVAGVCQPSGFCSFPDPSCPSGQRYGSHAGAGLEGQCVSVGEDTDVADASTSGATSTSTSTSTADTTSSSTSIDPPESTDESTGTTVDLDLDLVAWFQFEDPLQDGAEDSTENMLHGTCDACPTHTPGIHGNAALFDGESTYIDLPASPLLELTEALTVTVWARVDTWPPGVQGIVGRAVGAGSVNSWEVFAWIAPGGNAYGFFARIADVIDDPVALQHFLDRPALAWHHLALTWDGSLAKLYVDGTLMLQEPVAEIVYDAHVVRIGADHDFGSVSNHLQGAIDDVRIYRRALSDPEIAVLATAP